jgi:hypothetical protein
MRRSKCHNLSTVLVNYYFVKKYAHHNRSKMCYLEKVMTATEFQSDRRHSVQYRNNSIYPTAISYIDNFAELQLMRTAMVQHGQTSLSGKQTGREQDSDSASAGRGENIPFQFRHQYIPTFHSANHSIQ